MTTVDVFINLVYSNHTVHLKLDESMPKDILIGLHMTSHKSRTVRTVPEERNTDPSQSCCKSLICKKAQNKEIKRKVTALTHHWTIILLLWWYAMMSAVNTAKHDLPYVHPQNMFWLTRCIFNESFFWSQPDASGHGSPFFFRHTVCLTFKRELKSLLFLIN